MSQRYSTRFGSTLPNPNLGPEIANHFELGYSGYFGGEEFVTGLSLNAALYYSVITGKIVTVEWPNPLYPGASVDYARNLDSTGFWGFELSAELALKKYLSGGFSFSLNQYVIDHSTNEAEVIPYYPAITAAAYCVIKPVRILSIVPRVSFVDSRFTDTIGKEELDAYFLASLKVSVDITKYFTLSAGVENIFDTLYEISRNFPMAGRSYTMSLTARY
jgi:iron complex outermembrane receptor protein